MGARRTRHRRILLQLLNSTTPRHSLPMGTTGLGTTGKPSLLPAEKAATRVNEKCSSLQGKEDKSRKDVAFHCSNISLEPLP